MSRSKKWRLEQSPFLIKNDMCMYDIVCKPIRAKL